ncbi:MAG: DEAD/DEAH box helicase [Christensenellales bacterium]
MAFSLADLYGERLNARGHAYSSDDTLLTEFENGFGHVETEDQLTATEEGIKDLKEGKIMDRLLCGDVGYGKTEVALRIAFKVIAEGKQVAFMSPTTILATQHYETVKARMEPFGVNVGRMTRFDTPAEKAAVIEDSKRAESTSW